MRPKLKFFRIMEEQWELIKPPERDTETVLQNWKKLIGPLLIEAITKLEINRLSNWCKSWKHLKRQQLML